MTHDQPQAVTRLLKGAVLRLPDAQGHSIAVFRGQLWITQENDWHDALVSSGETFDVHRPGVTLVQALQDSSVLVLGAEGLP